MKFEATADRGLIRAAGRSQRYLHVAIEAPEGRGPLKRMPVNASIVVDRSGSMSGEKIRNAVQAAVQTVRSLRDEDRFSVVAYDDLIEVIVPSRHATAAGRCDAERRLRNLDTRAMTDLCAGWLAGCEEVARHPGGDALGRTLLLSDGLANAGITNRDEIVSHCRALRDRGVSTSTFGIGADFDEVLLSEMASAGGGNFYYIESAAQIPDFISSEVGEALEVVAREVDLVVQAPPGVKVVSVNEHPVSETPDGWRIRLGSLVSGQQLDTVLLLSFPRAEVGAASEVTLSLDDAERVLDAPACSVNFRYADHRANDSQQRNRAVDRHVAGLYAEAARRDALARNREHDYKGAARVLRSTARRIEGYAGNDPHLKGVAGSLDDDVGDYEHPMDAMDIKQRHFHADATRKGRGEFGRARRVRNESVLLLASEDPVSQMLHDVAAELETQAAGLGFTLDVREGPSGLARRRTVAPPEEHALVAEAARDHPGGVRVLVTRRALADNWFSHWHRGLATGFVTLADWPRTAAVPIQAFLAHEILIYGLAAVLPGYDPLRIAHVDTRGCVFDFCGYRPDVEISLQAADICQECRRFLERSGAGAAALGEFCEEIRTLAHVRQGTGGDGHPVHA